MPNLRKDMKIGLLAGAALLVLAVAYALFLTLSGPAIQQAALDKTQPPQSEAGEPEAGVQEELRPQPELDAANPSVLMQAEQAPAEDWSVLGLQGPIVTETPSPGTRNSGNPLQPAPLDPAAGLPDVQPQMNVPLSERMDPAAQLPAGDAMPNIHTHVIAAGETLSAIAKKYYGDESLYTLIEQANPNVDARRLKVGQKLLVPDREAAAQQPQQPAAQQPASQVPAGETPAAAQDPAIHIVAPGDTLGSIAKRRFGREQLWQEIYNLNRDVIGDDPARLKVGMKLKLPQ